MYIDKLMIYFQGSGHRVSNNNIDLTGAHQVQKSYLDTNPLGINIVASSKTTTLVSLRPLLYNSVLQYLFHSFRSRVH